MKLSEREFGPAMDDARHRRKLNDIYGPVLRGHIDDGLLEPAEFFADYQIMRCLWLAARLGHERDRVMFLLPEANVRLAARLDPVLAQVGRSLRSRLTIVHIETLLERLRKDAAGGLAWYAWWLQQKYVPAK